MRLVGLSYEVVPWLQGAPSARDKRARTGYEGRVAHPMDKAERRAQILAHARDVFAKRGYHAAKIDDIVAAAGIARGTFYLYFEDKRAVFEEIVDGAFARLGRAFVRVDPDHAQNSVAFQVTENIRGIVATLLEDRATTKILLSDAVGLDPDLDKKLLRFYEALATILEEAYRDGQSLGVVAPGDVRIYAVLTLGAMKELFYQVVMRGLDFPEARIVDEMYAFLCRGVLRVDG